MFIGLLISALTPGSQSYTGPSDDSLIRAAQRGSADAFSTLHTRYYTRIYRLAYLKTNNASDAEDVASETFLRALNSLSRFQVPPGQIRSGSTFYPWLHRIAINLIVDSARRKPPSPVVSLDAPVVEGMRDLLSDRLPEARTGSAPQEIVELHEVQELVRSAIATLPEDQGEVLVYRFLSDLSLREIAPLMDRSESAVKSLLHRAVVALRVEIRRRIAAAERINTSHSQRDIQGKEALQHVGGNTL